MAIKMTYLLDTNIWLERLLDQDKSEEVDLFLSQISTDQLLISDFSLHSIGVILNRFGQNDVFIDFIDDVFIHGGVNIVSVPATSMHQVVDVIDQFNLDFDDAYQYIAAIKCDAVIISFDRDFDRTEKGRRTPSDILSE